jgi:hydroxymethylglutaryl-CoA synthase
MSLLFKQDIGISAIGLAIPQYGLPLAELAKIHNTTASNYTENLGCQIMSLCADDENVVTLAVRAAKRALQHYSPDQIGMVIVATESGIDMSRPLSAWVMHELGLKGNIRSYEIKHACYGGAAAVRQAVEWILSGNAKGKAALVIAADIALYAPQHSGEPSQGAGAVAMVINEPMIAAIDSQSYYWTDPQFDFWRPIGNPYPEVNGRLTLTCYIQAVLECFKQLAPQAELPNYLDEFSSICMHVPFPKMVQRAFKRLGEYCGWDQAKINAEYAQKIQPNMQWNQQIGNSYTASLWFSVANALTKLQNKQQFIAFSYGSGCGAELLKMQCNQNQANSTWQQEIEHDLNTRTIIDADFYRKIRDKK